MENDTGELILGILLLVLIVYLATFAVASAVVKQECLSLGWRDSEVTWNFQRYCIREENEYEVTRPLADIIQEQGGQK